MGLQSSLLSSCLGSGRQSHASLVLPASSGKMLATESFDPPALSRPRGGCEGQLPVCCPGAVAAAGTREQLPYVEGHRIPNHHPVPGLPAVSAAVMGTGSFPELRQGTGRCLCPATVAAAGGREGAGHREAAAPDHPVAEGSSPHPATPNGGREWKPGRGGDRQGHAQETQEAKFSITAVVPPRPRPAGRGRERAVLRWLPAQPRGAEGRWRRTCFRRSGGRNGPGARLGAFWAGAGSCPAHLPVQGARLYPVCGCGGAPLGVVKVVVRAPGVPVHGVFGPLKVWLHNGRFAKASANRNLMG